jgi:hypothetical protein
MFVLLHFPIKTAAQGLKSDQYQLDNEQIEFDQPSGSLPPGAVLTPLSKKEQELFNQNGYLSYELPDDIFNLSLSSESLTFGDFTAFKPVIAGTDIQLMSRSSLGYQLSFLQLTALKDFNGNVITNTKCNSSCSKTSAGLWNNDSITGIGYKLKEIAPDDFRSEDHYRVFSLSENGEHPVIALFDNKKTSAKTHLTVKIVPGPENVNIYNGIVQVTALPGY